MATFEEQVNDVVSKGTLDDAGNLQFPKDMEANEEVLFAARLEKRNRDTQSAFTRNQQELKRLKAENSKLVENWEQEALENLTSAERSKLDELKSQDPDAYIQEITTIKQNAKVKFDEKKTILSQEIAASTELETREALLEEFNKANPDFAITDDVITNDIPPRIVKKLEKGEIDFTQFLAEVKQYVTAPKKIKKADKLEDEPDLSGGSESATEKDLNAKSSSDYKDEIY